MSNKVWVFVGKTEDCENHVMVFAYKPTKKELKEAFETEHDGLYTFDDLFENELHEATPRSNPKLKKIQDGPY